MSSLSWAQIAAKHHKPSPLRHQISGDRSPQVWQPSPASSLPLLTVADFPSLVEDKDGSGEKRKSPAPATSQPESPCTDSEPAWVGEVNEESGLTPSSSKKENFFSSPSISSTSSSPTTTSATATAAGNDEMGNTRKDRKAARKAAEEVAKQARLPSSLESVASCSSVPAKSNAESNAESNVAIAAATPLPADEKDDETLEEKKREDEKHDDEKHEESGEQGRDVAVTSNGEEAGGVSSEASTQDEDPVATAIFYANETYDCAITLKDGNVVSAHREVLVSESTYLAQSLPSPNEVGVTHYKLDDYDTPMMSVVIFWMYMGELGGHQPDRSDMWSSHYILNNVMFYRPATLLGVKSLMKYELENMVKAENFLRDALNGRFFYYKFDTCKKLAGFEMPLRMAHIHLYTQNVEKEFAEEIREMKVALARLTLVVLPFLRRQYGFINNLQKAWEALPFPWRSEMEGFYHEGLLPDFRNCFDATLQWVEEKTDDDHFQPQIASAGSSSTSNMPYYQASINEMTRRLTMAGFDSGYHF
ncbi:hypothetical protein CT0861_05246 [Colletotrichum tofieldiae]|uniref:BTB domain-containing protein n=1 Tax=Colletotrichum tofieldiae TaxID=708197 RepID=A0A161WLB0_9PEZI|nr:hypothetical protein CT0861_05246 [Colletotrichum tofieldiae]GKT83683.1 hypothetical protein Ct61P_01533 [Colletotrichum tofieldiae]